MFCISNSSANDFDIFFLQFCDVKGDKKMSKFKFDHRMHLFCVEWIEKVNKYLNKELQKIFGSIFK